MNDRNKMDTKNLPAQTNPKLEFLNEKEIEMIDIALSSLGKFGELRLVVRNGVLRYLITQISTDALKFTRDSFEQTNSDRE